MRLPRVRFTVRRLMVAVATLTLLILSCIPLIGYLALTENEGAEHVDTVSWLPREAGDISYYRSYMFTAYEFSISERGFLVWAKAEGWTVRPIGEAVTVNRCLTRLRKPPEASNEIATEREPLYHERSWEAYMAILRTQVSDGYFDQHRQSNGGGYIVAFDRKTCRAYYQSNPR